MVAGYVIFVAILLSIGWAAMKLFPPFAHHVRIGLLLLGGRDLKHLRVPRQARVIPFRSSRRAA